MRNKKKNIRNRRAQKVSENEEKVMSEGKKKYVKIRNRIIIFLYLIFSIYALIKYFSWKSLIVPMMKNESSVIVDSEGNILEKLGTEKIQSNVKLSDIPENIQNAYIDIEDERFYSHKGVDVKRTTAAIGSYVIHGGKSSFGGSTITQQLVKNLTGNDDNSITRKMEEWIKASELESFFSKEQILETYFNVIYLAPNTYGVDMASKYYFNKDIKDLDLAECAFLAGINNSPNSYNPFGEKDNSEKIKKRTKLVLEKMLELKDITQEQYDEAITEVENGLNFKSGNLTAESNGIYSYHEDAVISEVISDVASRKNISKKFATNYVYMSGLTIHSTEKKDIQNNLEDEYNKSKYIITSSDGSQSQSAMVILDQSTGYVVGCVGGLGEKKTVRGLNRATQSLRQTGSAIKPIAVLAPGIDKKIFTAATIYNDEQTTFNDGSDYGYSPTDNDDYIGEITVRRAVESSQNIPFVKMMEAVTPNTSVKYLKNMGITSLTNKDETLSLALGGLEKGITPLEMAGAYATIANDGVYIEPTFYTKIENNKGKTVLKTKQKTKKVFSKEVAYILKELLKQPVEGSDGTAKVCKIDGFDVAAKTGTTNENYDKWLCGFTTYYTAVTWYGYDMNETISYKGKSPAALLWSSVMKNVHSSLNKTTFENNTKVKQATICAKTGKTANSNCQDTYTEYFLSGTIPSQCVGCNSSTGSNKKENTVKNNTVTNNVVKNNTVTNNTNSFNTSNNIVNNTNTSSNSIKNNVVKNENTVYTNTTTNNTEKNEITNNKIQNNTHNEISNNIHTPSPNKNKIPEENYYDDDEEDDGP